jgi:hypothetical protein
MSTLQVDRILTSTELGCLLASRTRQMGDGEDGSTHQPVEQLASLRAIRRRHPLASRLHAVLGHFRAPDARVPRQRAAAAGDGAGFGGAGIDVRVGAICRLVGSDDRNEDLRSVGTIERTPAKVRIRAGQRRRSRQGTVRQEVIRRRLYALVRQPPKSSQAKTYLIGDRFCVIVK